MSSRGPRGGSKVLLSLCHQVDVLSERIRASVPKGPRLLESRRRNAVHRLRAALHRPGRDRFRNALRLVRREHGLDETSMLVVLLLFNRRIRRTNPAMSGRELLESVSRSGSAMIESSNVLHPDAALLRTGLISGSAATPEDVFDAEYRISVPAFRSLYRAYHGVPAAGGAETDLAVPYRNVLEHLSDMRLRVEMARRRAARLFPQSYWAEVHSDEERPADELHDLVRRVESAIAQREECTANQPALPLVRLRTEFKLTPDEELILSALLVQELFTARQTLELGELLRLVATSETEVITKRHVIAADSTLRRDGLITVESESDGKDLMATAWLAPATTERLLGDARLQGTIGEDERRKFHDFLEKLRGSDDFFQQL